MSRDSEPHLPLYEVRFSVGDCRQGSEERENMPEIRMTINTGFLGAEHEKEIVINDVEWEGWTPEAREQYMQEELDAYVADEISAEWEIAE